MMSSVSQVDLNSWIVTCHTYSDIRIINSVCNHIVTTENKNIPVMLLRKSQNDILKCSFLLFCLWESLEFMTFAIVGCQRYIFQFRTICSYMYSISPCEGFSQAIILLYFNCAKSLSTCPVFSLLKISPHPTSGSDITSVLMAEFPEPHSKMSPREHNWLASLWVERKIFSS